MSGGNGSRPGVRFQRIELDYGRHSSEFNLEHENRPFVIEGPNGTGKSSLVEGLVRTLYGFRRGRRGEREAFERRRPWSGGPYRGSLRLETTQGEWVIERDFETDLVTVTPVGGASPLFEGEANPTRAGQTARRYRSLIHEAIGLSDLDHYLRTACVLQGGLSGTKLNIDLLRVAAGGHTDVESAHARLQKEYRALTLDPIGEGASKRRKAGAVERLVAEVEELEGRARAARIADEKRGPLVRAREDHRVALTELTVELSGLESAFETLSEARRLEQAAEASQSRLRRMERVSRELDEALARLDLARDRLARGPAHRYPEDFLERARALEEGLWPREIALTEELERLRQPLRPPSHGPERLTAPVGMGLLLAATLLWVFGVEVLAVTVLVIGLTCLALWFGRRRAEVLRAQERQERRQIVDRDLEAVSESIGGLMEGLPEARTLAPETLPGRRSEFAREAADRDQILENERALRTAMDLATRELNESGDSSDAGADFDQPKTVDESVDIRDIAGGLAERARHLHRLLHDAVGAERNETLAPLKVQLGEIGRVRFDLPAGVDPTVDGARAARRGCLDRSDAVRAELADVERALAVEARPEASALLLERQLDDVKTSLADRRARAAAYRAAYRLVGDAYESFRQTDEQRLMTAVSTHLDAVSDGALGPLQVENGLEDAKVLLGNRALPIDAPPLSYGQLHIALLSIRMGAADFLAGLGVQLPLLIDDPFVHLDERSAAELWRILDRIALGRQVIIATQDRLVLNHLGVEADLTLKAASPGSMPVNRLADVAPTNGTGQKRRNGDRVGTNGSAADAPEEAPDLWSQLDD